MNIDDLEQPIDILFSMGDENVISLMSQAPKLATHLTLHRHFRFIDIENNKLHWGSNKWKWRKLPRLDKSWLVWSIENIDKELEIRKQSHD